MISRLEILSKPETVLLSADSIKNQGKQLFVFNADIKGMEGTYVNEVRGTSSYDIRQQLLKTNQQQLIDNILKGSFGSVKIVIQKLTPYVNRIPGTINSTAFDQGNDDIIFSAVMMPVVGENYFKTENRLR